MENVPLTNRRDMNKNKKAIIFTVPIIIFIAVIIGLFSNMTGGIDEENSKKQQTQQLEQPDSKMSGTALVESLDGSIFTANIQEISSTTNKYTISMLQSSASDSANDNASDNASDSAVLVTNRQFTTLLQTNQLFRDQLTNLITTFNKGPFVFFESKPITLETFDDIYEFVLIATNAFSNTGVDENSFRKKWESNQKNLLGFKGSDLTRKFYNLGRDAMLVVPKPKSLTLALASDRSPSPSSSIENYYKDLKSFLSNADQDEIDSFWQTSGQALNFRVEEVGRVRPSTNVWFSTCGTGVYFLHIRLDSRPKYYSFGEYRKGRVKEEEVKYSKS